MEFTVTEFIDAKRQGMPFTGKGNAPRTLESYAAALRAAEAKVGKPLAKWGPKDGQKLLRVLDREGAKQATKNHTISALTVAFRWGIGAGLYQGQNPMEHITARQPERKLPVVASREQIESLFTALDEIEQEKFEGLDELAMRFGWAQEGPTGKTALIAMIQFYGGLRTSEVLGLRKADIREDGVIVNGKGRKQRWVPLTPETMERLRAFVEAHPYTDYVFYGEAGRAHGIDLGKPMAPGAYYRAFREAVKRVGLPQEFSPHNLRHSVATLLAGKAMRLEAVQDFLGHSSPTTTRIYVQVSKRELADSYGKIFA